MQSKQLGKTGVLVPEIGLGTWHYRGEPQVIWRAVELGSVLVDTAENYRTEGHVGKAIKGKRDQVFLATKVAGEHLRYKDVLKAADGSLRLLGTDRIDLYQVHWPNAAVPIGETMRAMDELVTAGKVRFVGVSNFSARELQEAQRSLGRHPIVANQVKYSLFDREIERELIPYCDANDVTVLGYSPLEQGRFEDDLRARPGLRAVLDGVCAETGKTKGQVLLNWAVYLPGAITIPATNRVERVDENCAASGWRLSPAQYAALSEGVG